MIFRGAKEMPVGQKNASGGYSTAANGDESALDRKITVRLSDHYIQILEVRAKTCFKRARGLLVSHLHAWSRREVQDMTTYLRRSPGASIKQSPSIARRLSSREESGVFVWPTRGVTTAGQTGSACTEEVGAMKKKIYLHKALLPLVSKLQNKAQAARELEIT